MNVSKSRNVCFIKPNPYVIQTVSHLKTLINGLYTEKNYNNLMLVYNDLSYIIFRNLEKKKKKGKFETYCHLESLKSHLRPCNSSQSFNITFGIRSQ